MLLRLPFCKFFPQGCPYHAFHIQASTHSPPSTDDPVFMQGVSPVDIRSEDEFQGPVYLMTESFNAKDSLLSDNDTILPGTH